MADCAAVAIGAAAAAVVGERLPKRFRSETLIMLVPQRIPEAYVKAAAATRMEDRLASLEDQLLSRSRLEKIILDLDLYSPQRQTVPMEEIVQRMRTDVTIQVEPGARNKDSAAFRIMYVSNQARTAQKTTERLASLFIEENLRDRANVTEDTSQFLESQLQDARRRLEEQENKVEQYRLRYSGQLPSQANANLQALQNLQLQLQALRESGDRGRERRLLVERQLADLQSSDFLVSSPTPVAGPDGTTAPAGATAAAQLEAARERLRLLETHYKPTHPDVQALQRTIRDLEAKAQAEANRPPSDGTADKPRDAVEIVRQKRIRDLKSQMDDIDRELAEKQQQEKELRAAVGGYQAKLDAVPTRESDLVELTRDYDTLQATYQSLLSKREESNLAANLERRRIGEQFRVLDKATLPERAFSPNVINIMLGGSGAGLALGLLLVGFLEYRDSGFKTEDDVTRVCGGLPVLASVPQMASEADRRVKRRRLVLTHIAAACVLLVCATVIVLAKLHVFS